MLAEEEGIVLGGNLEEVIDVYEEYMAQVVESEEMQAWADAGFDAESSEDGYDTGADDEE